jgi:hypothetical protein
MTTQNFFSVDIDRAKELATELLDADRYGYELVDCIEYLAIAKDRLNFLSGISKAFEPTEIADNVFIPSDIQCCLLRIAALEIAIATLELSNGGTKLPTVSQAVAVKPKDMYRLDFIPHWHQLEADTYQSLRHCRIDKSSNDIHANYRLYQGMIKL